MRDAFRKRCANSPLAVRRRLERRHLGRCTLTATIASTLGITVGTIAPFTPAAHWTRKSSGLPPIAFVRGVGAIYVQNSNGKAVEIYQGQGARVPKWFPGKQRLAFLQPDSSTRIASQEIWSIGADGTALQRITSLYPMQARFISVAGSPPFLVYDDDRGIWAVNPDGSGTRAVVVDGSVNELALSRDGQMIAYTRQGSLDSPSALYAIGADGRGQHRIFVGTVHVCGVSSPSWSPDGRSIAFSLCVNTGGQNLQTSIWLVDADGRRLRQLRTRGVNNADHPTWSPDGRWIAFQGTGRDGVALFVVHPGGIGVRRITATEQAGGTTGDSDPDW